MRPVRLTMKGFETYLKENTIDFTELGDKGLYLITGDTGSGKTTIFDAITYSLYGIASGGKNGRNAKMLRSTLLNKNEDAVVDFTFSLNNEEYQIIRTIHLKEHKDKETGEVEEEIVCKVKLFLPGSVEVIDKLEEAKKKVTEILGIDSDQFCQIAMIAQGKFQQILTANSEERHKLFTTLFRTKKYNKVEERIDNDYKEIKDKIEKTQTSLKAHLSSISCDENYKDYNLLQSVQETDVPWDTKTSFIEGLIDYDEKISKELSEKKNSNQEVFGKLSVLVEDVKKLKEDEENLKKLKEDKKDKKLKKEKADENLYIEKEAYQTVPELEKKKGLIENELSKYDELEKKTENLSILKEKEVRIKKDIKNCISLIEKEESLIENLKKEKEEIKDADLNYEKLINEKEKCSLRIDSITLLQNKKKVLVSLDEKIKKAEYAFSLAMEKANCANEEYVKLNSLFLHGQAGVIASSLKDGDKCPVCGSIFHEALSAKMENVPTEEEVKEAFEKSKKKNDDATLKSQKCGEVKAEKNAKKEEYDESYSSIFKTSPMDDDGDVLEKELSFSNMEIKKLLQNIKEEEEKKKRKGEIEKLLPESEKKLNSSKENKEKLFVEQAEVTSDIANGEMSIEELKSSIKFDSKKKAEDEVTNLRWKIDKITKQYQDAQKNYEKACKALDELNGKKSELEDRISKYTVKSEEEDKIIQDYNNVKDEIENLDKKQKIITSRLSTNKTSYSSIKRLLPKYFQDEKRYAMLKGLKDTMVGGNLKNDTGKVRLETYAQMAYFDLVLYYGNQRLKIMSSGQYEFTRRKVAENNRSRTGLDIDIIDHHTAAIRDVKSLSGGESFQASLALALGLADEVCSNAGGIKLDTMFIDEGFGTLDHETMQKAYDALRTVSQGNKLVGIISHVDFLKEHIEQQLVVTKDRQSGSTVKHHILGD